MENHTQTLKVFYLDDEKELAEIFKDEFESEKFAITIFTNPKEALTAIENSPPDVFFIDNRLPGFSGIDIAKYLDKKIPRYLISGDLEIKSSEHVNKIFSKPYQQKEILEVLETLYKKKFH